MFVFQNHIFNEVAQEMRRQFILSQLLQRQLLIENLTETCTKLASSSSMF